MKELSVVYRGFGASIVLGTLADDGRSVLFQYSPQAIEQRLELSPLRLPLRQPAYPDTQGQYRELHDVPGLVYDSLPDGWGYRLIRQPPCFALRYSPLGTARRCSCHTPVRIACHNQRSPVRQP